MAFNLTSLPSEIICRILLYLSVNDIFSLSKCLPLVITKEVYHNAFPNCRPASHYDLDMFRKRAKAKLYAIGDFGGDFGGYGSKTELIGTSSLKRMYQPYEIQGLGTVVKVSASGSAPSVLNARCEAVRWKQYHMGRIIARQLVEDDYEESRYEAWRLGMLTGFVRYIQRKEKGGSSFAREYKFERMIRSSEICPRAIEPACRDVVRLSNILFRQPFKPTHFTDISSGKHQVALDDNGLLWFDTPDGGKPMVLVEHREIVRGKISQIKNSLDHPTFLVEGRGVVKATCHLQSLVYNGVRSGYICMDDQLCSMEVETWPKTAGVKDYVFVEQCLICLWPDGTISAPLEEHGDVISAIKKTNQLGTIVQISGSDSLVDFLTDDGRVINVSTDMVYGEVLYIPCVMDIPDKVVSISVGNCHCLALTEMGEVYAWGKEVCANGCIGLGHLETVLRTQKGNLGSENLEEIDAEDFFWLYVDNPVKVDLPGKVYSIAAQDSCSVFLVEST